jgi:hypothetical protein
MSDLSRGDIPVLKVEQLTGNGNARCSPRFSSIPSAGTGSSWEFDPMRMRTIWAKRRRNHGIQNSEEKICPAIYIESALASVISRGSAQRSWSTSCLQMGTRIGPEKLHRVGTGEGTGFACAHRFNTDLWDSSGGPMSDNSEYRSRFGRLVRVSC